MDAEATLRRNGDCSSLQWNNTAPDIFHCEIHVRLDRELGEHGIVALEWYNFVYGSHTVYLVAGVRRHSIPKGPAYSLWARTP